MKISSPAPGNAIAGINPPIPPSLNQFSNDKFQIAEVPPFQ